MVKVSTVEARSQQSEVVNRAAFGGERILLTRRGKAVAAVVPVEDVKLLEALEEQEDLRAIREALEEQDEWPPALLEDVAARLGARR